MPTWTGRPTEWSEILTDPTNPWAGPQDALEQNDAKAVGVVCNPWEEVSSSNTILMTKLRDDANNPFVFPVGGTFLGIEVKLTGHAERLTEPKNIQSRIIVAQLCWDGALILYSENGGDPAFGGVNLPIDSDGEITFGHHDIGWNLLADLEYFQEENLMDNSFGFGVQVFSDTAFTEEGETIQALLGKLRMAITYADPPAGGYRRRVITT